MDRIQLRLADLDGTAALAAVLAPALRPGDVVALTGDLGSGKTTLVRFLLATWHGAPVEVPSPTFTLVQTYGLPCGTTVWHFDLYRLSDPDEVTELGWEDALASGISLVEWPDRLGPLLPATRLHIHLAFAAFEQPDDDERLVTLTACGGWRDRLPALADALAAGLARTVSAV